MEGKKKAVAAAAAGGGAEGTREEETERLHKKVSRYSLLLYVGAVTVMLAPRLLKASRLVPCLPRATGDGLRVTCAAFTVVTLVQQTMLARVLERRPAPAPRLAPLDAWPLGYLTWAFVTLFCIHFVAFGGPPSCSEWVAAGVASAANLAMAARTVMRYLA